MEAVETSGSYRVQFDGPGVLSFHSILAPVAAERGKLLLRTRWTMISTGTELAFFQGCHAGLQMAGNTWAKYPFEPGYAAISEVVDVGQGVEGFSRGQNVFHWGKHRSWSMADPADEVVLPVPEMRDPREALLARFAQIAATAVVRLHFVPQTVLIMGAGLIGILAARMFELAGSAEVTVQDINPRRLDFAAAVGLKIRNAAVAAPERKFECVIEATGVEGLFRSALRLTQTMGTVVMLGSPGGEQAFNFYQELFAGSLALVGAHEGRLPVMASADGVYRKALNATALNHIAVGRLRVAPLITGTVPFAQIEQAYRGLIEEKDSNFATVIAWQ